MTSPTTSDAAASGDDERLLSAENLPFTAGAVALVTLGALENRAVGTLLPTIVGEFDAISSFGVVSAAPIASYIAALAFAGRWADRSGPLPPLRAGVAAFAVVQVAVAAAVSFPMLVAGRVLSGFAEGLIDVGLMVLIARTLPENLRPKIFSLFATAWVLPSVAGPALTGVLSELVGWRWVFLGALGILVPTWLLIRPAVRASRASEPPMGLTGPRRRSMNEQGEPVSAWWAILAAAGVFGLTLAAEELSANPGPAAAGVLAALVATAVGARGVLPTGTLRLQPGIPAIVALRAAAGAAFAGAGAWLPLALTLLHGYSAKAAGLSLSITGVMWAFGSWLQSRDYGLGRPMLARLGFTIMAVGLTVTSSLAWMDAPLVGLVGWAVAGIGQGIVNPSLSVLTLAWSDDTNQGRNSSAASMAGSLSFAAAVAVSGTAVAFATPRPGPGVFAGIVGFSAAMAMFGALASRRLSDRVPG